MSTSRCKGLMHKVPPLLRLANKSSKDLFDPLLVSIGPYHHGKPELELVEGLKPRAVQMFVEGSDKDGEFYLNKILETINDVRSCYVEGSTDEYDDVYLANMMLQDACFLFKYEEMSKDPATIYKVGRFLFEYVFHDTTLLENQIPFSILKMLNYSTSDADNRTLLDDLLTTQFDDDWGNLKLELCDDNPEDEPIHLLELERRMRYLAKDKASHKHSKSSHAKFVEWIISKFHKLCISSDNNGDGDIEQSWLEKSFRSAVDLKAKGIHCKVGTSSGWCGLEDIKFKSAYFYGELQLPKWNVTIFTKVYLSNMIGLENYLVAEQCLVSAYVNIMKILLQSSRDVRELREQHVLTNLLRSDEDLLQSFLDLAVTSWDTLPPFSDVLDDLEVHYRKHTNKWVAELIQTYFRTPWTTIAFIAPSFLLCLTIIQTYFAIHPTTP